MELYPNCRFRIAYSFQTSTKAMLREGPPCLKLCREPQPLENTTAQCRYTSRNYPDNNVEMYDLDRTDALSKTLVPAIPNSLHTPTDSSQHQQQQDTSKELNFRESVSSSHYQHANIRLYLGKYVGFSSTVNLHHANVRRLHRHRVGTSPRRIDTPF
jgi:hypothetical protein